MPLVYGPLFNDEYSMQFDGTDDYISVGRDVVNFGFTDPFSVSLWFKPDYLPGHATFISKLLNQGTYPAGGGRGWTIFYSNSINFQLHGSNWTESENLQSVTNVYNNLRYYWHHLVLTYSGTRGVGSLKMYLDGFDVSGAATSIGSGGALSSSATTIIGDSDTISGVGNSSTPFPGNLDEIAIFDYTLTQSEVGVLYNGIGPTGGGTTAPWNDGTGKPNNVGNLPQPPIKWYRMGDNAVFKDPQWLLPENRNKDKVSNYSMSFDGTDEWINCGRDSSLDFSTQLTISSWIKTDVTVGTTVMPILFKDSTGAGTRCYSLGFRPLSAGYDKAYIGIFHTNGNATSVYTSTAGALSDGNWHHLMGTYDGTDGTDALKIYVDGVLDNTATPAPSDTGIFVNPIIDIAIGSISHGASWWYEGNLDEIALWGTDQSSNISFIYSGGTGGTLPNLSSLNPVSYWKMGDMAYSASTWVIPDQGSGGNTGISDNMEIFDRVGDAPSSSGNTLSYNMELNDRVNDTPG